ncbi:MFS transporter [Acinetobacter sp. ANC 4178]|uniref:MFS transporter n=1 Tax=Acinetobacter sp. ANC 4178 TaxID=2529839 RepID=UPI00103EC090|nr:MFS transporter [Acinetobacter sp. ANC 4178]TCB66994.1 MFS transporter [Acinetobacter sp. ANC 4178]
MPIAQNVYLLLFSLYWAQGLPVGFMTHALPVILRAEGVSLAHIGGFGLLMLPWSIKILWAPWIDRLGSHQRGHYRSWIIPTQLLTVIVLIVLSFLPIHTLNEPQYLFLFFIVLLSLNFVGATQDIATDGLAVRILKSEQQHWGNTFQVIGSRLGFIVGGGAMLWMLDGFEWQTTFLLLAGLVLLNTLPVWLYRESTQVQVMHQPSTSWRQKSKAIAQYLKYYRSSPVLWRWFWVLLTFKVADGLAGPLLKPLMVDLGLSFSQIGVYVTILGAIAALCGAGVAGVLLRTMCRAQALWLFSWLKIMSLAAYAWLAYQYEQQQTVASIVIYAINAAEDAVSAMLLVMMLTLIMQYSRTEYAATDFTFQVAVMATVSGILYSVSGVVGDALGYANYLFLIVFIAIFCLVTIFRWVDCEK